MRWKFKTIDNVENSPLWRKFIISLMKIDDFNEEFLIASPLSWKVSIVITIHHCDANFPNSVDPFIKFQLLVRLFFLAWTAWFPKVLASEMAKIAKINNKQLDCPLYLYHTPQFWRCLERLDCVLRRLAWFCCSSCLLESWIWLDAL